MAPAASGAADRGGDDTVPDPAGMADQPCNRGTKCDVAHDVRPYGRKIGLRAHRAQARGASFAKGGL
jgi:hypothetical protein